MLLLLLPLSHYLFCMFNWQIGASVEAWMVVLPRAWLFNKHLAPAPDSDGLFWTLEGNAYFASGPLNVTMMLCRNSALMRFVWLQTTWTKSSLELSFFFFFLPFQFGMLSSSLILTWFLKHRGILSSLIPLDDQGSNICLRDLLDLAYWFLFILGQRKLHGKWSGL